MRPVPFSLLALALGVAACGEIEPAVFGFPPLSGAQSALLIVEEGRALRAWGLRVPASEALVLPFQPDVGAAAQLMLYAATLEELLLEEGELTVAEDGAESHPAPLGEQNYVATIRGGEQEWTEAELPGALYERLGLEGEAPCPVVDVEATVELGTAEPATMLVPQNDRWLVALRGADEPHFVLVDAAQPTPLEIRYVGTSTRMRSSVAGDFDEQGSLWLVDEGFLLFETEIVQDELRVVNVFDPLADRGLSGQKPVWMTFVGEGGFMEDFFLLTSDGELFNLSSFRSSGIVDLRMGGSRRGRVLVTPDRVVVAMIGEDQQLYATASQSSETRFSATPDVALSDANWIPGEGLVALGLDATTSADAVLRFAPDDSMLGFAQEADRLPTPPLTTGRSIVPFPDGTWPEPAFLVGDDGGQLHVYTQRRGFSCPAVSAGPTLSLARTFGSRVAVTNRLGGSPSDGETVLQLVRILRP